jgi:hypothetical protein
VSTHERNGASCNRTGPIPFAAPTTCGLAPAFTVGRLLVAKRGDQGPLDTNR